MSGAKKKLARREAQTLQGLSEREKQELQKQKVQKRNRTLAIVGGIAAVVLVVALLVWHSGVIDRHRTVVKFDATQGKASTDVLSLTRADMDYYYYQAVTQLANLYSQAGIDYTLYFNPSGNMKEQFIDENTSYDQHFREQALENAKEVIALYNAAMAEGYTLSEDAQSNLDKAKADLDTYVAQTGLGSRSNYLRNTYGRSMNEKVYFTNMERSLLAYDYLAAKLEPISEGYSDEALDAYFAEHTDELMSYDYDFAYFDGTAQPELDENGNTIAPSDEDNANALALAKASADALVAGLQEGSTVTLTSETGEDALDLAPELQTKDFTTLAQALNGQPYTQTDVLGETFANEPFADWLMDSARQAGDVDVFELENVGYYVVQFHDRYRSEIPPSADVRHILVAAETDEELTDAKAEAERILAEFQSGEQTGERFAELAEKYSEDGRDENGNLNAPGGLYENVTPATNFVPEFLDWIFVPERKAGDVGIVQTAYGYHIMYADSVEEAHWKADARSALLSEEQNTILDEIKARYEVSVNKWVKEAAPAPQESPEDQGN